MDMDELLHLVVLISLLAVGLYTLATVVVTHYL